MKFSSDTVYSWVLCAVLVTLELYGTISAPVGDANNIIKTPCGGPVTITEVNKKPGNETISQLHILVTEAKSLAGTLQFEMTKAIGNSDMVTFLDNFKFFKTIKADEMKVGLDTAKGLGHLFKSNFGNFSELAIYINLAAGDTDASHVVTIKAVMNKVWLILCELQIGTLSQGESITHYLTTDIISDQILLVASPEEILFRNYIIMRDIVKNIEQFSLLYKYIKDRL